MAMREVEDSLLDSPISIHSFRRSMPLRASKINIGPFRATQIWNEIITHLKTHVEVKRRRYKMRTYDNSFSGAHAVDVVMTYLLSEKNTFSTDLSREKAVKLCQSLMDRRVFCSISNRTSEIKKVFDDSHHKLYRFVGMDIPESQENSNSTIIETSSSDEDHDYSIMEDCRGNQSIRLRSDVEQGGVLDDSVICNPIAVNKKGQVLQEIISLHHSLTRRRSRSSLKCDTSILSRSGHNESGIPPEVMESLWREVALCQLLTLVEIPFLEGLLSEEKSSKKSLKQNVMITSSVSNHYNSVSINNITDPFMRTAVGCIECLPNGLLVLEKDFVRGHNPAAKIQAFHVISGHYRSQANSLLPENFIEVHLAILNFIIQQKPETAIVALQLDMVILPWHVREEVRRLLKFMVACAEMTDFSVDSKVNNETLVLDTFTDCIIKHKVVAHKLARVLVLFLMKNFKTIFTVPKEIKDRVVARLSDLKTGKVSPVRDNAYCSQVTSDEYQKQAAECTNSALVIMMNGILDDTHFTLKEKKQRLRQFQKCHPDLYIKNFNGML
ncbi:DEP domain-containing protein 7-like [Ostrea edulis]|uniref:DEP domain-containing protein 7-like n=1 Tax=Ostrea edulis TaxID=37623 RepID=UPI0024AEE920|nr:DEP domain-containing protein 7-like [Ostrea edulis]